MGLTAQPDSGIHAAIVRTEFANTWQARIALSGELDGATAPHVRAELERHLTAGRRVLRVDTRSVRFVDSTVLTVLLEFHWRCLGHGGTLLLNGVRDPLRRLLSITGLDEVLLIDRAEAFGAGGEVRSLPRVRISGRPL